MTRTAITNALYVLAFDGSGHRLLKNGTVVYEGDSIIFVGREYPGKVDAVIDASNQIVIPGLVNVHCHLLTESINKGFLEDQGSRKLGMSGLFEYLPATAAKRSEQDSAWLLRFALTELLKSGCTTVVEMGNDTDALVDVYGEMGVRAYIAPGYKDAHWYTRNGHEVLYEWDAERGRELFKNAVRFIEKHSGRYDDRIRGFLAPMQVDTCTEHLLLQTKAAQRQLNVPVQIHVSQSTPEFAEMMRRHGMTPVEWLGSIGFLSPDTILGHCIFVNHHASIRYKDHDDMALVASSGASVAHAPWVFARRGLHMQSFGRYVRRGINVGIGTDSVPQDMLGEMRWAAVIGKNAEEDTGCPTAAEVFDAATLGGAQALGREDLGRIAPGAKADLVLIDANNMAMRPLRDPIKNIVYYADNRVVSSVIVNGKQVVQNAEVTAVREADVIEHVQRIADKILSQTREHDWANRTHDQLSPLSYKLIE